MQGSDARGRSANSGRPAVAGAQDMSISAVRRTLVGPAGGIVVAASFAWVGGASAATWVLKGRGFGHGVGMSQYGAYGLARHGRGYRAILEHYYRHTRVGKASGHPIRVLLGSGSDSVAFKKARKACGKRLRPSHRYRFKRSGSGVTLRGSNGRRLARCGHAATAVGNGTIRIRGKGSYRGTLRVKAARGVLCCTSVVAVDGYARGVVANEMPSSWSQGALRDQAVAARSFALAVSSGGSFDVYDDTRSQVYGGKASETRSTNRACKRTKHQVIRYRKHIATTYYSSSSGGRTEAVQFGFPGATPVPYLKSVKDPYDRISPDHSWKVRYSQGEMES